MKTELRERYRARRREFHSRGGVVATSPVNAHLRRLIGDLDPDAKVAVCAYHARPDEVAINLDPRWYLPRISGDEINFYRPEPGRALATNRFGIAEPDPAHAEPLDRDQPTLTCCPALAVDRRGGRLGSGKAFYDRYFTRHPRGLRIGVVYHVQVATEPLPADSWDQPLDWIVTEQMILRTSQRSLDSWT